MSSWSAPAPRSFPWLHLTLFALTALSLTVAGAFWNLEGLELSELATVDGVLRIARSGVPYALAVLAVLGAHEMGHYFACRYYRIPVTLPFFLPGLPPLGTFGAVLRIRGRIPDRRALFDIAAAGPIAGIALVLPALVIGLLTARAAEPAPEAAGLAFGLPVGWIWIARALGVPPSPAPNALIAAAWVGAFFTALNLFPVGQLDGGHVAFAISRRLHRFVSFATIAGLGALITFQVAIEGEVPAYVPWLVILLWMRDRHPPVLYPGPSVGRVRIVVAVVLAMIWVACFIPLPIRVLGP